MIAPSYGMTSEQMEKLITSVATLEEGRPGKWKILYQDRPIFIITNETHNRVRIMSVITSEDTLDEQDLRRVLTANFDRALDARFALADGYLWSVFTHPLWELTDKQFLEALRQVRTLAENYGLSYASSDLFFGGEW